MNIEIRNEMVPNPLGLGSDADTLSLTRTPEPSRTSPSHSA
jgi:hypothetical protein